MKSSSTRTTPVYNEIGVNRVRVLPSPETQRLAESQAKWPLVLRFQMCGCETISMTAMDKVPIVPLKGFRCPSGFVCTGCSPMDIHPLSLRSVPGDTDGQADQEILDSARENIAEANKRTTWKSRQSSWPGDPGHSPRTSPKRTK